MNVPLEHRLAHSGAARLTAPDALLDAAFPALAPRRSRVAPLAVELAVGAAAAAGAALAPVTRHDAFDRGAANLVVDLAEALAGGPR